MRRNCTLMILTVACVLGLNRGLMGGGAETDLVRCTGRIVDEESRPVAGVSVVMYEALSDGLAGNFTLEKAGELATTEDGAFAFAVPSKPARGTRFIWSYIVAAKDELAPGWAEWEMRGDMAATLVLGAPACAEGTIVDAAGRPIADARVLANLTGTRRTPEGEEKKEWLSALALPSRLETRTDSQGRFAFEGLPKDATIAYLIEAAGKATVYTQEADQDDQAPVRPGQTGIRFVLPEEGRITGRIVDPDTSRGAANVPFAVVPTFSGLMYYRLVCTTDENGAFAVRGLKPGRYVIRGDGLPHTYVEVGSGATTQAAIVANQAWYGRILFDDGEPAVVKPAPWPGAETEVFLAEDDQTTGRRVASLDDQGYFRVYLSQQQFERLQAAKACFHVRFPERQDPATGSRSLREETVFAVDLLARDKAKAGAARIAGLRREPVSLVGKVLPSLDQLSLGGVQGQVGGRIVLLCLFDMQQRLSRHFLTQLAGQAGQLAAKGVTVIAVQAATVDQKVLAEWIKASGVSFVTGAIAHDAEKTRFEWGVASLPHLILTDSKHVVVADGFGLGELDKKIEEASGR